MAIDYIDNGELGSSVRTKLNALIDIGNAPVDISSKMDKLINPTDAQQTEMLTVDANGQAVGVGIYVLSTQDDFINFVGIDTPSKIGLLLTSITLDTANVIDVKGSFSRIISESAVLNISGAIKFNINENHTISIEPAVYGRTNDAGFENTDENNLSVRIRKLISSVTSVPFSINNTGVGSCELQVSNSEVVVTTLNGATYVDESLYFVGDKIYSKTGTAIDFIKQSVFNTASSPATGNITFDQGGAKIGVVQKVYHQSGTPPTFSGVTNVVRTSGVYQTGQLNRIYAEWVATDRVEYRIENEASGWWHEWNIDEGKTTGKGYIDDAGNFTINLKLSYDNVDTTQETFDLFSGVSGVCYVESVWDVVTKANTVGSNEVFAYWQINNIIPYSDIRDARFQLSFYDLIRAGSNGTYDDYDTNDGFLWVGQSFGEWTGKSYPTYETYSINPFPEASTLSFIANYNNSDGIREITIRGVISDKTKI